MDNNTVDINQLSSTSLQNIYEAINKMESRITNIGSQNQAVERQITSAIEKRDEGMSEKNNKLANINSLLNKLIKHGEAKQRLAKTIEHKVVRSVRMGELQMGKNMEVPVPSFNFNYHINNPGYFPTLTQLIQQMQENSLRERTKREDEIRTLKIRISLAQIQLKELKNRSKKI